MKKTFSTLSLIVICAFSMGNTSCQSAGVKPFPVRYFYIADLTNKVCVEYPIIDAETMQFGDGKELPLLAKGPCDRLVGMKRSDFKAGQNWIRDAQRKIQALIQYVTE